MIFRLNLEKAVFKLTWNLTSKLQFNGFHYGRYYKLRRYYKSRRNSELEFRKDIWWSQFRCRDGWTSEWITKLGWDVKIKSMQEAELLKIHVSSFIFWFKLDWEVAISILDCLKVVISSRCQAHILALKSPNTTIRDGAFA